MMIRRQANPWRDGRVVDGGGLENRFPERGRGFESYSLRQKIRQANFTKAHE